MALTVLLCTDGSELAAAALAEGLAVLGDPDRVVLAMVIEPLDPTLVVGTGMAGGLVSPEEAQRQHDDRDAVANQALEAARTALGLMGAEVRVLAGQPGPTLCDLARDLPASVVVLGTRGRGGLRRAVLGSVSDHIVRNAPCPVLTRGPA